jgi:GTP-binding protein HflX
VEFSKRKVLLTDTVGFIDRLPLKLVKAFHSTLEETIVSDVIILVVDFSEQKKEIKRKLYCSFNIIQQIGGAGIPVVTALNKIDLVPEGELESKIESIKSLAPNLVSISTLNETNIASLKKEITRYLEGFVKVSFSVKINDESMSLISDLFNRAHVLNIKYDGDQVKVVFRAIPWFVDRVTGRVKKLGGIFLSVEKNEGETSEDDQSCCFEMGSQA